MASKSVSRISKLMFQPSSQASGSDVLIYIYLRGGMDGLSVVIPYGDIFYYYLHPKMRFYQPEKKEFNSCIDLNGYFGLHPALSPLLKYYKDSSLAFIHAVGMPAPTHSHTQAQNYLESGSVSQPTIGTGWLGRHLASKQSTNSATIRGVSFGSTLSGALRGSASTVAIQSLNDFSMNGRVQDQAEFQNYLQTIYHSAGNDPSLLQIAEQTQQAIDFLGKYNTLDYASANYTDYPQTAFGKALADTYQLINAGIGLEVVCLEMGGWDTHVDEGTLYGNLSRQLTEFAQGITAFMNDLGDKGKNVLIMTVSEFGRRASENNSHGTDHGQGNAMFLLGSGVLGGKVYGKWPTLAPGSLVGPGDLAVTTDYRDVFANVVKNRLGNTNVAAVFPDYTPKPFEVTKPL